MSLEYYLLSRKAYNHIIEHFMAILNWNETIETHDDAQNSDFFHEQIDVVKMYCKEIQRYIKLKEMCSRRIIELCEHEYIEDEIDIDAETSQKITYCHICEHTK